MKVVQEKQKYNEKDRDVRKKKQKKRNNQYSHGKGESSEDLDDLYHYLTVNEPQNRKRMSKSIDNSEKKEEPTKVEERMQKYYGQKRNKKVLYPGYKNL